MGIKEAYYYVFFKIYKFLEQFARPNWLIKSRAKGLFSALQVSVIWTFYFYYKILYNRTGNVGATFCVIISIIIMAINLFVLYSDDRIEGYINKFNGWPKEKNDRLTSVVTFVVLIIAIGFIVSVFLYSQKFHPPG
jgi:EamA domain-containing membrane protein RarD